MEGIVGMTCQAVQRMLLEEEDRRRRRTVARHLASCPACRRYAEDLAQIARPGAVPLIDPGEPLLQQTLDRIRHLRPRVAEAARRPRRLPEPALRTAWAAAAALAVAAAAVTWWIRRAPPPERIGAAAMPLEEEITVLEAELLLEAPGPTPGTGRPSCDGQTLRKKTACRWPGRKSMRRNWTAYRRCR